ncbi:DUF222 domain-containing protein, partial [Mycobacterium sp. ACS1612]|uniref:DUF222 domain-containing protein n=1 Tax=Mycobacterium sp. ACS1612 TaxID=1834117 RepID=UPI000A889E7A
MGEFISGEAARQRFRLLAAQVDAAHAEMRQLSSAEVGNEFRVEMVEQFETQQRVNRGLMYRFFGQIADPPDEPRMAPRMVNSLAARLRITPGQVKARMKTAAKLAPRRQLCGPPLPPVLPYVAAALAGGQIGEDHVTAIANAIKTLPSNVSVTDRDEVEASLVGEALKTDAEIVKKLA